MKATRWRRRARTALDVVRLYPVFVALGTARRRVPLDRLARWSWNAPRLAVRDRDAEHRIVSSVLRLGGWAGRPERDCLVRSLLLYRELSRAGADPRLLVGFRRQGARLEGHAWVETDGAPVSDPSVGDAGFETLCCFGPNGALQAADAATR